jgi:hypothetical protein
MQLRYQESAVAMGRLMREAGEHIAVNSQLDLTPTELVQHIDLILIMLTEARYHAERMEVYAKLLGFKDQKLG